MNGYVARKLKSVNVTIINPKVAGFKGKEWLSSSEIKEDGLRFVEHQCDDHQRTVHRWPRVSKKISKPKKFKSINEQFIDGHEFQRRFPSQKNPSRSEDEFRAGIQTFLFSFLFSFLIIPIFWYTYKYIYIDIYIYIYIYI